MFKPFSVVYHVPVSPLVRHFAVLDRLSAHYHEMQHEILLLDTNGLLVPTALLHPDRKAEKGPLCHVFPSYHNYHSSRL